MSIASIGLSGMRAAQSQLGTSAHNIANSQTPNFQRQSTTQTAQPGWGGTASTVTQRSEVSGPDGGDFGRLVDDVVTQKMAVYNFAANLRSVEAEDRMLGSLLDMKA